MGGPSPQNRTKRVLFLQCGFRCRKRGHRKGRRILRCYENGRASQIGTTVRRRQLCAAIFLSISFLIVFLILADDRIRDCKKMRSPYNPNKMEEPPKNTKKNHCVKRRNRQGQETEHGNN